MAAARSTTYANSRWTDRPTGAAGAAPALPSNGHEQGHGHRNSRGARRRLLVGHHPGEARRHAGSGRLGAARRHGPPDADRAHAGPRGGAELPGARERPPARRGTGAQPGRQRHDGGSRSALRRPGPSGAGADERRAEGRQGDAGGGRRRSVDRRTGQRDPAARHTGRRREGDRRRQRDRHVPLPLRRRPQLVRRQRLRLLGLAELRPGGGRPARGSGDLRAADELGRTRPGALDHRRGQAGPHLHVRGRIALRHQLPQRTVRDSRWQVAQRSNAGFVARHWPGL